MGHPLAAAGRWSYGERSAEEAVVALPDSDTIVLLHNPRCSKSRAVRALLQERGTEFEERRYLEDPLSRPELEDLGRRLARPAREWVRGREAAWQETGIGPEAEEGPLLDAVAAQPILLERPIVIRGRRAIVARPPEVVGAFLDEG
jgi:arsenate reductase